MYKEQWLRVLASIKSRCSNPNVEAFKYYGAKGIKCELSKEAIKNLWFRDQAHLLKRPSIDRIDPQKNYNIENCRFIELSENSIRATKVRSERFKSIQISTFNKFIDHFKFYRKGINRAIFIHKKRASLLAFYDLYKNSQSF